MKALDEPGLILCTPRNFQFPGNYMFSSNNEYENAEINPDLYLRNSKMMD